MRTMCVVPTQVVSDVRSGRAHAVVGLQIHPFVFDAAPQALDKDIVTPGAAPVHRQLAAAGENDICEFHRRELAALIRIDDLRRAVAGKGLLDHFPGVHGFQRDRHLVRQNAARGHVHHGGQIYETPGHGDEGR